MTQFKHDPANKGIIILSPVYSKHTRAKSRFCVTFPRLQNLGNYHSDDFINHSGSFRTYAEAHDFAVRYKQCDRRVKDCPIWLLSQRWVRSSTTREFQRVG